MDMDQLRIAMVCPSVTIPDNVAQSIHQWEFAKNLAAMGHEVHLFAQLAHPDGGPWQCDGVHYHPVRGGGFPLSRPFLTGSSRRRVRAFLKHNTVDLVHDRGYIFGGSGLRNAARFALPSVLQVDDNWLEGDALTSRLARTALYQRRARRWIQWAFANADAPFTVSKTLRRIMRPQHGSEKAVHIVPNGVDIDRFRPDRKPYGLRDEYAIDGPMVIFVGALGPWHGVDNLLAAARTVLAKRRDISFVIVGGGREYSLDHLSATVRSDGLAQRIIFTGPLPSNAIPHALVEADLALAPYPARDFGFSPFKIFEYMAAGRAVVAADLPSIRELIDDGETGVLVNSWEPNRLADAILGLLANDELRERLGSRARTLVAKRYTWERSTEKLLQVYDAAMAGPHNSRRA